MDEIVDIVNGAEPGDELELTLLRDGDEPRPSTVTLGDRPELRRIGGSAGSGQPACRTSGCMRVKFCGITNLDDAAEAVRLGAWAIGLIHYDESPRCVEPAVAGARSAPPSGASARSSGCSSTRRWRRSTRRSRTRR